MDFRDWLISLGVLLIVGILADGYRRMRNAKKQSHSVTLGMGGGYEDDDVVDVYSDELPSGGSRVVSPEERAEPTFGNEGPDLDQPVPVLMESVDDESAVSQPVAPVQTSFDDFNAESEPAPKTGSKPVFDNEPLVAESRFAEAGGAIISDVRVRAREDVLQDQPQEDEEAEEVFVITVVSRELFGGEAFLQSLLTSGMKFGDMNIFHRYEQVTGKGQKLFSLANAFEPGTFDLDNMEQLETRAVTFFMGLPGPKNPMQAFNLMVETAKSVAQVVGGELKDENRSVLTTQTAEHNRQRIREYERKKLSQRSFA